MFWVAYPLRYFISYLECLVHGHISDPIVSMCVYSHAVRHIEKFFAPTRYNSSSFRVQYINCFFFYRSILNHVIYIALVKSAKRNPKNIYIIYWTIEWLVVVDTLGIPISIATMKYDRIPLIIYWNCCNLTKMMTSCWPVFYKHWRWYSCGNNRVYNRTWFSIYRTARLIIKILILHDTVRALHLTFGRMSQYKTYSPSL